MTLPTLQESPLKISPLVPTLIIPFGYTDNHGVDRTRTLAGEDFLSLIFQHVLPKGFRRVRDYGFLHLNAKATLHLIQQRLYLRIPTPENKRDLTISAITVKARCVSLPLYHRHGGPVNDLHYQVTGTLTGR